MASVNEKECEAAGLNPLDVKRIAQGLSRYAKEAQKLGIEVFGGSGSGSLRFDDRGNGNLFLAVLDGDFNGGHGAADESDDGLIRGEY
ncbi:hypothetical protein SAMN05660691_03825 [Rheinheimera pacifica]|uniref:Uncharacterized protein n=1 Tax=Rheinheimera pacifica TaxID=173990 RepID=A0A1H6NLB8_9GAMM|nr:hypothetical protein [Rheinheimera pacifica]SEI11449.1 hypothetical protein SAMN05660691_03825 [Rheinheimera pacifica]